MLARSIGTVGIVGVDVRPGGDAVAAWSAPVRGTRGGRPNRRIFAARLRQRATAGEIRPLDLSGGGGSVLSSRFVPGVGGPLLVWWQGAERLESARWSGPEAPLRATIEIPGEHVVIPIAGSREGRVVAGLRPAAGSPRYGRRILVALSTDAGRTFSPAVAVEGSRPALRGDVVATMDSTGGGALSWLERSGQSRTSIVASVVPARAAAPLPATTLAELAGAPGFPVIAAREGGGALVGWVQTTRKTAVASETPGAVMVRGIGTGDAPLASAVRLGGPGERGRGLHLQARGGRGATAFWVTPSGALRAQDLDPDGRPGRAVTLDHGVTWYSLDVARGGGAVAYLAGDRARLVRRVGP